MEHSEKNIDWDKLLALLESKAAGGEANTLTEEEKQLLQMADEIRMRLKNKDAAGLFPADEGWARFQQAIRQEPKVVGYRRYLKIAAAVAILIFAGWMGKQLLFHPKKQATIANALPEQFPEIKMANGKSIRLADSVVDVQAGGAHIQASGKKVVYKALDQSSPGSGMDTLEVPRGRQVPVQLVDGTIVTLNAESKMVFPQAFTSGTRTIEISGEAYLAVAPDAAKPFVVNAAGVEITVLGTEFNVNTYDRIIYTTLVNGKVKVAAAGKAVTLKPGEQMQYNSSGGDQQVQQVDTHLFTAWKDGVIYFEDASLKAITNSLARDYDYNFKFKSADLMDLQFTIEIPRPASLQVVLDKLSRTTNKIVFRVENRTVIIDKK